MNKNAGTSRNRKIKDVTTAGKTSIQPAGSAEFQALLKMKSIVVARLETRTRRFLAVSPAFVDLTGYSEAELSSLSLDQITLPEDAAKSRGLLEQIWLGQAPDAQWEQRCLKKDGTVIWLNLTETLIQSGPITEDDPLESIILAQDIDERKKSELEQMLRAFESRFKSLVNSIEGIVWECIVGAEGIQFSFVSDKAERLLGYPVEQWITEKNFWQNHIHPEDRKWAVEFCATATAAKRDHELEYRMIAADGKVVWLRDLVTVVAEQGQPMRLVGVMVDMTAHKQTEQTVKATEERLRRTQSTGRLGVWEWELESRKVTWTDGIYELLGLVPGSFDPSFDRWKEFIFEEDNARTMEAIQRAIESEGEFRVEFRVRRADGEVRWLGVSGRVENDESGKPLRMIGVNVDITKQKLTEAALVESRARERAFLEHLPVGVWFLNAQGEIVYGNPAGQQIWEGARFVEVEKFGEYNGWWHGSDRKIAPKEWAAARAVMKGETTLEEAVDIQCFDGSRKTILNSAVPVLGPEGALMGAVVFNQDITKRIEAEKTLKFSEARFRLLVDQLPFSLQILDPSGKTVKVNRAWQKLWGITLDQLEGYNLLADPQLKEKGILPYLERGFYGEMAEIPRVCYVPDRGEFKGKERWTRGFVYPVKNEDGTLREVVLMHEDITAQQEAEEALRASEERFRAIISQITAGIAQVDRQGKFTFVNDRFCQITGFTREELLQMTMQDITSREILEENMQKIQQLWHGAPPFVIEKQYTRKDGSKVWVNNSVAPVKGADGQIESVVSVTIDVNERKQVEEALRSSEERLRHATEASQLIVVEMDFLKKWVKCSPNAKEIWGISEGPVESFFDIIHPEDRPAMRAKANAMQRGERGYHAEYRVITPAGETRWLNSRGDIFLDSEGRPVSYAGVSVDVTERKRSEQALQETSERLRVATQTGKLGVWEWNIEGNEVIWTDSLYPMHGVTKDDFEPTGEGFTELIHPDDRERVGASIQGSLTSGAPYEISFRVVRRDGKVVWLFTNGIVLREEGKPVRMLGATTDITELKVAEEELRQSRERLQAALIGSGSGTFRWNIQTDELILDEQNNRLFGIPEGKQLEGFKHFFEILHPDDHGPFLDEIARCKKGSDFELEYRVIWPDGSVHWIFDKGKTFLDPKGNPIYMAGSCVDITKRKEAEQQLAQTTAILKAISDNSPDLVYAKDTEGRLIIANPALCGFLNKKADQLLGKNELQWGGDTAETRAIMGVDQQVLNGRRTMVVEEKLTGADGASRVFLSAKACWFDASGEVIGLIGISRDITERKQAEEALQTTADRLSLALAAGKLGDWSWDAATDVVDCSAQAAEIFGLPPGPSITWTQMQELLHEEDREMARYAVEKAIREQSRYEATYRVVCKDGSEVWVAAFGLAQYAANGRPVAMLGVIQDITDRKTTELALANAQHELKLHAATLEKIVLERTARLRDTVAELEHFSYTITHDMRAPLRTMQGFAQIIKDEYGHKLDAFGADYLRRIIDSAIRMDNLITDSLNYAKTVQTELTLEPLDVSALLRGIVESYPQFQWPRAEIEVAATTPLVLANQAGLTQCFSNLLGNAVKFVEAGKTPKVKVWAEERDAKVRFWVEDNGIGIPLDQQKKVFTMFQRMTSEFEGTGVGLALVRKVVEKMRGKVGFESEEGKGSRFWVELARAGERS